MNKKQTKHLFYGLLILLAIFTIFKGYKNLQLKEAKIPKEEAERKAKEQLDDMLYRREAVLLSLKYKVAEDKVFNILVEENDIMYKSAEFDNYRKKARQRIEGYSTKYDIPTDIISSILIDDAIMQGKSPD